MPVPEMLDEMVPKTLQSISASRLNPQAKVTSQVFNGMRRIVVCLSCFFPMSLSCVEIADPCFANKLILFSHKVCLSTMHFRLKIGFNAAANLIRMCF